MKRLFRVFVLSKSDQRVVLIIILALIGGALVRYERRVHALPVQATAMGEPKASSSPPGTKDER